MFKILKKFKSRAAEKNEIEETENLIELKNNIEKHFKKQNLKVDELLDTIIELQESNEIEKEHNMLIETIIVLHESLNLIQQNINDNKILEQIALLNLRINEQLLKAKIIEISNEKGIFNIKKHEIVGTVKIENESYKHGEIKKVIAPGYFYKGKLVKKAKVIVYELNGYTKEGV
jgi:molecular chaperone GrpE (heat shock protein)